MIGQNNAEDDFDIIFSCTYCFERGVMMTSDYVTQEPNFSVLSYLTRLGCIQSVHKPTSL